MSEQKHTELPWAKKSFVDNRKHGGEHHTYLVTPQRGVYGTLFEADASFIVRACNAHYDLLEALKYVRRLPRGIDHDVDFVDAAIAKAEGRS